MTAPAPAPTPNPDAEAHLTPTDDSADDEAAGGGDPIEADDLPTSFGVFKPVGHVMIGLPTQEDADALVIDLHDADWPDRHVRQFSPQDTVAEMQEMIDNAGLLATFGYEIKMLSRYMALTEKGYRWLVVKVDDDERATAAADLARHRGATMAVQYRTLTVEDLIF